MVSKILYVHLYLGVSKNSGVPQNGWKEMKNPIKMDDLGGKEPSYFWFNTYLGFHDPIWRQRQRVGFLKPPFLEKSPRQMMGWRSEVRGNFKESQG